MTDHTTPEKILDLSNGFKSAKVLLTAVEIGVFTELAKGPKTLQELRHSFGLSPRRSTLDFFDCLVSLGMLDLVPEGYINTAETDFFLDKNKTSYIGGLLEMYNDRLYRFWGDFTEGLISGKPQNEAKTGGEFFAALYADPKRLSGFMEAMTGISLFPAKAAARKFHWNDYRVVADIGCAQGVFLSEVVRANPHLRGIGFDLEPVQPIFDKYVEEQGLKDSLTFKKGNFFNDDLPLADVLVFGQILHDWSLEKRKTLLRKAYQVLPKGGAVLVYDFLIDDERRKNTFGLLSSLTMLIETCNGFDYTEKECKEWMAETGFSNIEVICLSGQTSMVIGNKDPGQ